MRAGSSGIGRRTSTITPVSRTVGENQVVDEVVVSFTHDCAMPAIPAGRRADGTQSGRLPLRGGGRLRWAGKVATSASIGTRRRCSCRSACSIKPQAAGDRRRAGGARCSTLSLRSMQNTLAAHSPSACSNPDSGAVQRLAGFQAARCCVTWRSCLRRDWLARSCGLSDELGGAKLTRVALSWRVYGLRLQARRLPCFGADTTAAPAYRRFA